jgi:hypothetical protein
VTGYDERRTVLRRQVVDNLWAMPTTRDNETVRVAADTIMSLLDGEIERLEADARTEATIASGYMKQRDDALAAAERRLQELVDLRAALRRMPKNWPMPDGRRHEKVSRRQVLIWINTYVKAILARQAGL